jgi:predicted alternative tryptophan synthase beta-subunit
MPQVYVFRSGDKWMIRTEGRVQGHFADHAHAVAAAIDIAESIGKTGRDAQVLVHAESRTFRKLWVYGKDLYPNSLGRPNAISLPAMLRT